MSKPTTLPRWADDETNNTEPSSGQKDTGWTTNQVAVSSYFNWYMYLVYQWLSWINGSQTKALSAHGGVFTANGSIGDLSVSLSGAGSYHRSIPLEEAQRLRSLTFSTSGDGVSDFTEVIIRRITLAGVGSTLAIITSPDSRITNPTAIQTDLISFVATTGAITINADPDGSGFLRFTRTTGSYITDGFAVGMSVAATGYVDGAINVTAAIITSLTATVMITDAVSATEAGTGNETITVDSIPTVGVGEAFSIEFTASAASPTIGNMLISYDNGSTV